MTYKQTIPKAKEKKLISKKVIYVAEIEKDKRFNFVSDEDSVNSIKSYFGKKSEEYDSFFVVVEDGSYKSVYGMEGNVPYLNKQIYKIY